MNNSYSKDLRLKSSYQYQQVLERSKAIRGKYIILHAYHHLGQPITKLGIIASKKFGKATERNRFKRITREAFRKVKSIFPKGTQLVVRPRKYAIDASMFDILDELVKFSKEIEVSKD